MRASMDCKSIEPELIAAASGEADAPVEARVERHIAQCPDCRSEHVRYRAVEAAVGALKRERARGADAARERLLARLADLRSRLVRYRVFSSALGPILVGATEHGITVIEYLARGDAGGSRTLARLGDEAAEASDADATDLVRFHGELVDYLRGGRTQIDGPLDWRLARSGFQRAVLEATAAVPYGAVSSYAGIARDVGRPAAVRAVAQALRHNPLPIVVPCHRIVGSAGSLVGYAGNRVGLKERLLGLEGVRTSHRGRGAAIDRGSMYAWHRSAREYCLPTCGDISDRPIGEVTLLASPRQAHGLGLSPCGDCRPDLHPLRAL